jgi:hypothetical protein
MCELARIVKLSRSFADFFFFSASLVKHAKGEKSFFYDLNIGEVPGRHKTSEDIKIDNENGSHDVILYALMLRG